MKLYLAATYALEGYLKAYLAGDGGPVNWTKDYKEHNANRVCLLESFYYVKPWQAELIPWFKSFMLDSGAFTFMQQKSSQVDFEQYTREYAKFINDYGIELFFELDIDSVVPWQRYLDLRKMLEDLTGKDPIPVFHKSRGKEWFQNAVRNHSYVAIGGIVTGEIKRSEFGMLRWFIDEAHRNNCKIHGLGFTNLSWLQRLSWDSVDSTAWLYGNRSGVVYQFDGKTIQKHKGPDGARLKSREVAIHNFNEWVKFAEYMEGR